MKTRGFKTWVGTLKYYYTVVVFARKKNNRTNCPTAILNEKNRNRFSSCSLEALPDVVWRLCYEVNRRLLSCGRHRGSEEILTVS
jgi:hypothetical protein